MKQPKIPGAEPVAPAPIPQTPQPVAGDLPNHVDVDAKTITAPVLTRQGWVCPPDKPRA